MRVKLVVKSPRGTQTTTLDGSASFLIGRADGNLILEDARVSKAHALLYTAPDGQLHIRDLKSANGTFVNKNKISDSIVNTGDEVTVGDTLLTVLEFQPEGISSIETVDPENEILNSWPNNIRALPEKQLKDFIDHLPDEVKNRSVRLADIVKQRKK